MVKKWMKQLILLEKSSNIDFDEIIYDILNWEYIRYDYKELSWYDNIHRVRIWQYRIVFEIKSGEIKILLVWTRWDVYKKLKQMF